MRCHELRAKELFQSGYNCAQSVFGAYAEELGLDFETALKISSSFGAGMGRLRVVGLANGYSSNSDNIIKANHYKTIQYLAKEFEKMNGSIICRELLGLAHKKDSPVPNERTEEYYKKRPCKELVGDACRILDKYLEETKKAVK